MRTQAMLITLAAALITTGCSDVLSLNPAVAPADAVTDPALAGLWMDEDGGDLCTISQQADNTYQVVYRPNGDSAAMKFQGLLLRAGQVEILDLVPKDGAPFQIPAHFFVRVWAGSKTLQWAILDSDWFQLQIKNEQLATQTLAGSPVISAQPSAIRDFLANYGTNDKAYNKSETLLRVK
jgi:hypothetical protein